MNDRYAIDVSGFLGLAGETAQRLDDVTDAVDAVVSALEAVQY